MFQRRTAGWNAFGVLFQGANGEFILHFLKRPFDISKVSNGFIIGKKYFVISREKKNLQTDTVGMEFAELFLSKQRFCNNHNAVLWKPNLYFRIPPLKCFKYLHTNNTNIINICISSSS